MADNPQALLSLPSVANSPAVIEIQRRISQQEVEIANLNKRYLSKHPKMEGAVGQLEQLKQELKKIAADAPSMLEQAYLTAKSVEESLGNALSQQEKASIGLGQQEIGYETLQREVDTDRALYRSILTRLKETGVSGSLEIQNLRVIQAPTLPEKASKPSKFLVLAAAGCVGGLAGLLSILLLKTMDSSVKTVDEAEAVFDIPVLGAIPKQRVKSKNQDLPTPLPTLQGGASSAAEAFRTLRTSLSLISTTSSPKVFLVTSAVPTEGKSFCSANLAVTFAQQGLRTLLIEADLRKPRVGVQLGMEPKSGKGIEPLLLGQTAFKEAITSTTIENLWTIPSSGKLLQDPSETIARGAYGKVVKEAAAAYDRVVLDTSPVHAVSDTLLIAALADMALLVVQSAKTPRQASRRALDLLKKAGGKVVGVILNKLPEKSGPGGYHYHYSSPGYGGGYQDKRADEENVG
jgi:capsular exopolysaccharide synthesis family protein